MTEHDIDWVIYCCRQCGLGMIELVNDNIVDCPGTPGVTSLTYRRHRKKFDAIMDPILKDLLDYAFRNP